MCLKNSDKAFVYTELCTCYIIGDWFNVDKPREDHRNPPCLHKCLRSENHVKQKTIPLKSQHIILKLLEQFDE